MKDVLLKLLIASVFTGSVILLIVLSGCTEKVKQGDVMATGMISCINRDARHLIFNADNIESMNRMFTTDPYITVYRNGTRVKMYKSEKWICTDDNGLNKFLW